MSNTPVRLWWTGVPLLAFKLLLCDFYSMSGLKWLFIIIVLILIGFGIFLMASEESVPVTSFDECIAAGNPAMESYPRQCRAGDKTFVEDIGNELEKTDLIRVNSPRPNQTIESPLIIEGEARGFWFFEGDFPIRLLDEGENEIAIAIARAQGEWMVEDFVSFTAQLSFDPGDSTRGTLIFERDNPSGLPENDDELIMPIQFSKTSDGAGSDIR